jgi:hypothetical protein
MAAPALVAAGAVVTCAVVPNAALQYTPGTSARFNRFSDTYRGEVCVEADARTRTADPFITSVDPLSRQGARSRAKPHGSDDRARPRWRPKTG